MQRDIVSILKDRILSLEQGYEQKIAELSLLKELGDALKHTSLSHWDELFLNQLDIIKQNSGIFSVSVMLIDEETGNLYVVSASTMTGAAPRKPIRLKRGEGIAGKVFETARTLYIPDVTKDPNFSDRGTRQTGALACVPIVAEGMCIGVLNFRDNTPETFGPNDLRFFELIADQLSITASLVRTYQNMLSLEQKRINLTRYFSRGLAEHLVADERLTRLGGEKQTVSVLFADVEGFTTMVDTHDVEKVVTVLNRFFETVVPIIFRHGGMLDKFLGDGVLAVFGLPDAAADDPARAIACAVDMQRAVQELRGELEADGLLPITIGVGIATGVVVAGNIGTDEQMNYTVIGEPVNLAQRLEAQTETGEIIVSPETAEAASLCAGFCHDFQAMGPVRVKGILRDVYPAKVCFNPER